MTSRLDVLSLSTPISEKGLNLPQGQRQLLCFARAIISHLKIMVIDEGTSTVDMETDRLVHRVVREEFHASTLLLIAYRLSTFADFDRVLVLDQGKVVEFGTPKELVRVDGGYFRALVEASDERASVMGTIF